MLKYLTTQPFYRLKLFFVYVSILINIQINGYNSSDLIDSRNILFQIFISIRNSLLTPMSPHFTGRRKSRCAKI